RRNSNVRLRRSIRLHITTGGGSSGFSPHYSLSELKRRRCNIERLFLPADGTMPNASAECRNVDLIVILRIGNDTMCHLEIEALNSRPMTSSIGRAPSRGLKARGVKNVGVRRINGHVIDVAVLIE